MANVMSTRNEKYGTASSKAAAQSLVTKVRASGRAPKIEGTVIQLQAIGAREVVGVGWIWEGTKRYVPCTVTT